MKPIKINYKNEEGKRTSTTINETIAWHFFFKHRTEEEWEILKKAPRWNNKYDDLVHKTVQKKVQEFVTKLQKEDNWHSEMMGTNKTDIEEHLMQEIKD